VKIITVLPILLSPSSPTPCGTIHADHDLEKIVVGKSRQ
jgi:hypothetical protein